MNAESPSSIASSLGRDFSPTDSVGPLYMGAVIVSYHPDLEVLSRLIEALVDVERLVVVDNGSSPLSAEQIERWLQDRPGARWIRNGHNRGLAAALNQGLQSLVEAGVSVRRALLLDQDTQISRSQVRALAEAYDTLAASGTSLAAVGPAMIDDETGSEYGFHCIRGLLWRRLRRQSQPVRCASLNGSGTLLSLEIWRSAGPLDEQLFIDHVDTEWSFRVQSLGYVLYGIPWIRVPHRMGRHAMRFWLLGQQEMPYRPPLRHYYLFRNTILLFKRSSTPAVWRFWAIVKLVWTVLLFELRDPHRKAQWRMMRLGFRDGLLGKGGEIPPELR